MTDHQTLRGRQATPPPPPERWAAIRARGESTPDGCLLWPGATTINGYGKVHVSGRLQYVHRVALAAHLGEPIPGDLDVDHLCRATLCYAPAHLEAVTPRVNWERSDGLSARRARQTHCKNGHPFTPENTYRYKTRRLCNTCRRDYQRARRDRG